MQSEFNVAFKAYVKKNEDMEIRYFTIDRGAEYNFEYMKAKLMSVFPCLSNVNFTVSWKDNESDLVAISSNDELLFALTCMSSDVKKLYVTIDKPNKEGKDKEIIIDIPMASIGINTSSRKRPSNLTDEHVHVVCDSCDGPVHGFRYKCLMCPDFDLCQSCEASGKHPDHIMLRLPRPAMLGGVAFPMRKFDCLANMFKPSEKPDSSHGKKHCRERRSKDKHGDRHGDAHGDKSDEKHHGRHGRHERKHFAKSCRNPEAWVNTITSFMNGFTNLAEDVIMKPEQKTNTPQENAPSTSNQQKTNEPNAKFPPKHRAEEVFGQEIGLVRDFISGVKNGFYGDGFAFSSNASNEQNPPTPASGNNDARNVKEKSTTTDDCREQVDKNVTSAINNHPLFNLLEGKAMNKSAEQVNAPNIVPGNSTHVTSAINNHPLFNLLEGKAMNKSAEQVNAPNIVPGNSTQYIPIESDTDSNGSDCCFVAQPTEGEDKEWTVFNMDEAVDNEFIKISTIPKDQSMETDMEKIANEFKKLVEVGGQNKNGLKCNVSVTEVQPSDTRFILVEQSSNAPNTAASATAIFNTAAAATAAATNLTRAAALESIMSNTATMKALFPNANLSDEPIPDTAFTNAPSHNAPSPNAPSANAPSPNAPSPNAPSPNAPSPNAAFLTALRGMNAPQPAGSPSPFAHRDPNISVALQQMMAMGFSNEEGWLTQLLESGNGNINRVLDILSSVKK